MESHYMDEQLDTIKAFHSFLGDIIDKGYNNNPEVIKSVVSVINQYIKKITEPSQSENNSEEETEEEEEEDEYKQLNEKIQAKIDKFLKSNDYLSKIYLYQKDSKYINELNNFVNKLYEY